MTRYTIETRLTDGSLVDTIATAVPVHDVPCLIRECLAERDEEGGSGIIGILQVRPDDDLDDWADIWVIVPDGRKGEVIAVDPDPPNKPLIVRHQDGSIGYYYRDQVEPA